MVFAKSRVRNVPNLNNLRTFNLVKEITNTSSIFMRSNCNLGRISLDFRRNDVDLLSYKSAQVDIWVSVSNNLIRCGTDGMHGCFNFYFELEYTPYSSRILSEYIIDYNRVLFEYFLSAKYVDYVKSICPSVNFVFEKKFDMAFLASPLVKRFIDHKDESLYRVNCSSNGLTCLIKADCNWYHEDCLIKADWTLVGFPQFFEDVLNLSSKRFYSTNISVGCIRVLGYDNGRIYKGTKADWIQAYSELCN